MRHFIYERGDEQSQKEFGRKLQDLKPGRYIIEIKKHRAIRSLSANKYYHYMLNVIAITTGHTHEELHEAMKMKFNCKMIFFPKGGNQVVAQSTAELDDAEFQGYLNRVKNWANQEFGIVIGDRENVTHEQWLEADNTYEENQQG